MSTSREVAAMLGSGWGGDDENPLAPPPRAARRASFAGFSLPVPSRRMSLGGTLNSTRDSDSDSPNGKKFTTIQMRRSSLGPGVAVGRSTTSPKGSISMKRTSTGSLSAGGNISSMISSSAKIPLPPVRVEHLFDEDETETVGTSETSDSPTATPREPSESNSLYVLWRTVSSSLQCPRINGTLDYNSVGRLLTDLGVTMEDWGEIEFYHRVDTNHEGAVEFRDFEKVFRQFKDELKFTSVFCDLHITCMAAIHSGKVTCEMVIRQWQRVGGKDEMTSTELRNLLVELGVLPRHKLCDESLADFYREFQLVSRPDSIPICDVISMFHPLSDIKGETHVEYFSSRAPPNKYVTEEQLKNQKLIERRHYYNDEFKGLLFLYMQLNMLLPLFLHGYGTFGDDSVDLAIKILCVVSDLLFYWFMAMKLSLPCEEHGVWIFDKSEVQYMYLTSYVFWLDLLIALPLDLLPVPGLFLNPLLRLNKLALVSYINDTFGYLSKFLGPVWWRIVNALYWWVFMAHLFACIFPIIADASGDVATQVVLFVPNYSTLPVSLKYVQALSYSINTLSGLSRGAFPSDDLQAAFALVIVIIGVFVYALVLSVVSYALQVNTQQAQMQAKLEDVRTVLQQEVEADCLPDEFLKEALAYHRHVFESMAQLDLREDLLVDLPPSIGRSIAISIGKQTIGKVPILKAGHDNDDFICALQSCLQLIVSPPDFDIIEKHDNTSEMYFITSGELEVIGDNDEVIHTLRSGDFFGEIALITRVPRTATIRTKTFCNLLELSLEDYESVLSQFPGMTAVIQEHAKERIRKIRTSVLRKKGQPSISTAVSTSPTNISSANSEDEFEWIRQNSMVSRKSIGSSLTNTSSQATNSSFQSSESRLSPTSCPSFKRTKRKQIVVQIEPPDEERPRLCNAALQKNARANGHLGVTFNVPVTSPTGSILGLIDGSNRRSSLAMPAISLSPEEQAEEQQLGDVSVPEPEHSPHLSPDPLPFIEEVGDSVELEDISSPNAP
eukprot:TRINITY_DN4588_c0_g1_i1.p1 TRINITY_DN4588_c0_g1~~TRINITY_DN4588_c0_g1_i1.p1  ORF type:complete len:1009 (+),score=173.85 TRINITY_DN4588_c0_g1_i1:109-3135(+)